MNKQFNAFYIIHRDDINLKLGNHYKIQWANLVLNGVQMIEVKKGVGEITGDRIFLDVHTVKEHFQVEGLQEFLAVQPKVIPIPPQMA